MKKIMIYCIVFVCTISFMCISIKAEEETTFAQNAQGAYVMEYSTQQAVFTKNENTKMYPASMTKMMSLILVYEALNNHVIKANDMVTTSAHAASMGGSQVFLEEGEVMSVMDLLKSICIASANDAMVALAEKIAGSENEFVKKMNQKAETLHLKNTHFMNVTGLHHQNHYSSPKDMAMISKQLLDVGGNDLLKITSTYEDYIRQDKKEKFWLVNTNKLIRQYEGVDGLKTGYTGEAKSCISVTAKQNNIRFIVVVMGEPSSKQRNAEVKQLLDYSFTLFDQKLLYEKNTKMASYKVANSIQKRVNLLCEEDLVAIYEKGKKVEITSQEVVWLNKELPYQKGDRIAKLKLELSNGKKITSYLVAASNVEQLTFFDILKESIPQFL